MVGMEDGPYRAHRGVDPDEDSLFSGPPDLFLDEDPSSDHVYEVQHFSYHDESWDYEPEADDDVNGARSFNGDVLAGDLLPSVGLFGFDDEADEGDILFGSVDLADNHDDRDAGIDLLPSFNASSGLGPAWTDDQAPPPPPVVLHPAPAVDAEWSQAPVEDYGLRSADIDDDDGEIEDEGTFRKSRRFNRILMVLTILVVAGVVGAVYQYLNREQSQQTATADSGSEAQSSPDGTNGADSANGGAASGSAVALAGPDPVGIVTNTGGVRIVTATETDGSAAEYADPALGTATFLGLNDSMAFIVNEEGMAWRVNYRTDPTPQSLVDLNKDNAVPPAATTVYHFASAEDGTIYFTDVNGNLWLLDPTPKAVLVYTPSSPEAAIAQLATNPTTLFIRTIAGDVYRHEHGGEGATLAYGPSNDNPQIVSLAPTPAGVLLTAGGGLVRIVDPTKDDPLSVIYKPRGDKGIQAIAAGSGAAIMTESGNVVYAVLDAKDVAIYTADAAADKPAATEVFALGDGTIGAVDNDGSLWSLDLTAENPTKIWDAASLGPVASVQPNQDAFAVSDAQGNVWNIPAAPGGVPQELSAAGDARSIATGFFRGGNGTN